MTSFVRLARPGLWWLLLILLSACAGDPAPAPPPPTLTPYPPDLYIGLSDSATPLADLATVAYERASGNPAPVFLEGNDEALRQDVQQGLLEAAILYHLPADSQFWFTPIALDGVVVITHADLNVEELTIGQLRSILSGAITNWAEIGGPDLSINLLDREPGAGARDVLSGRLLDNSTFSDLARIAASDDFMQQEIEANPGSIGYTMLASASRETLRLDGSRATLDTVADQSYPLTTPIYFISATEPEGRLRDFLAWIQSPEGQAIIGEKYGRVR